MKKIDIQNFKKYYRNNNGNAILARIGHVNAVIDELENKIDAPENPNDGDIIVYQQSTDTWINVANTGGGGIEGTNYVFVQANGTPIENAQELQDAYDLAKTMSPAADNRITVIAAPGEYQFPSTFVMDTEYIDLVSLTGNRDVIFDLEGITDPFSYDPMTFDITNISECLLIDTDNVYVKGIKGKFYLSPETDDYFYDGDGENEDYILPIQISDNLSNIVVENCEGGIFSFGGDFSFGGNPITVSGTFIDCEATNLSFAMYGIASGTFIRCINTGDESFGSKDGVASGTFIDCIGGGGSFAFAGEASGTFTNCIGGNDSFGEITSGTFTNCIGGNNSFGVFGTLSGKLYYCRLTSGTFQTVSSGGVTVLCIDGNNQINTQN